MSKILKNTTVSDIELAKMGLTIPASGQITINETDYLLLADPDSVAELAPLVTSGDIVVNDGVNDLSAADGNNFLKYPDSASNIKFLDDAQASNGFSATNVQSAIEEGRDSPMGSIISRQFSNNGGTSNKWLDVAGNVSSNNSPLVLPCAVILVAATATNTDSNSEIDLEIHKNILRTDTALVSTLELRNFQTIACNSAAGEDFGEFNLGDTVSVFASTVGAVIDTPTNLNVTLWFKLVEESVDTFASENETDTTGTEGTVTVIKV